jgi:type I restriction enzyme R subunit
VGDPKRIALIAGRPGDTFRETLEAMDGKAMIVCMSRAHLRGPYAALITLRPDWASAKDDDCEAEKASSAWRGGDDRQR